MWARAKHAVCYNGVWYETGAVFQIEPEDREMMLQYCDVKAPKSAQTSVEVQPDNGQNDEPVHRSNRRRVRNED